MKSHTQCCDFMVSSEKRTNGMKICLYTPYISAVITMIIFRVG